MAPRKTARQKAIDKRKRAIRKRVKSTRKTVKRTVKRTRKTLTRKRKKLARLAKRQGKRTRRSLTRKRKSVVRLTKRRGKKIRRAARKRVRTYKRNRTKAISRQYTRRNISEADTDLIGGYTTDKTKATSDTAFLADYGNDPGASRPGEPPKRRSGKGRDAIQAQLITHKKKASKIAARTYVNKRQAAYMAMWEYRKDGKARPFLKPSVENNRGMLGDIIGRSLKKQLRSVRSK